MRHLIRLISYRRQVEHPIRTLMTILGIALGVASFISVRMILDTMSDSYSSMVDTVAGKVELQITGGDAGVDETVYDAVMKQDAGGNLPIAGLAAALPTIQVITRYNKENVLILAVDTLNDKAAREYKMKDDKGIEISDPLEFLNSQDAILLNREFAARYKIAMGSVIELLTSEGKKPFSVKGFLEPTGPASTFGGNFALMDVYAAQAYFSKGRIFDSIDLLLKAGASVDAVKAEAEKFLGGKYDVQRPTQRNEGVESMMHTFRIGLTVLSLVVLAMGGFIILNTVTTSVYQRMRETGILRMVGVTRLGVWLMFCLEAVFLGAVGSAIGVTAGFLAGRRAVLDFIQNVGSLFVATNLAQAEFTKEMAIYGGILGVGISLLGAMWPSYKATRITPLEVVRYGPGLSMGRGAAMRWWIIVSALSVMTIETVLLYKPLSTNLNVLRGLMFVILVLGIALTPLFMWALLKLNIILTARVRTPLIRLASENILRDLGRSGMTVAAFMVALAVMFEIYLFMSSSKAETRQRMDEILKADLLVTSSASYATRTSMPVDASLADRLQALPGVETVRLMRFRIIDYHSKKLAILCLEFGKHFEPSRFKFIKGDREKALAAFLNDEGVLISGNMVSRHPELAEADTVELVTPTGKQPFKILGVCQEFLNEEGVVMINRGLYMRAYNDPLVDTFQIYLHPNVDPQKLRVEIDTMLGDNFNMFVLTNREFRDAILKTIDQIFALAASLEIITMFIAIIGIINNLMANVIDRTREIGVIRSLGATRAQVAAIFFFQSGLLGFSGATVALFCGYSLGIVQLTHINAVIAGWPIPARYSHLTVALAFLAAVLVSIVAGLFPARKAAGLALRDALKYE